MENRRDSEREICIRLKAIETTLQAHAAKYGQLLDLLLAREIERAALRKIVLEKLVTGGMWAFVLFMALAAWELIKRQIK